MDIPNIRYVIHYGAPAELDEYIQEIGRCGRDGRQSYAVIVYHQDSLKGSHITESAKRYVRSQQCLRVTLAEEFGTTYDEVPKHLCCSLCFAQCSCCSCGLSSICLHVYESIGCYCVRSCYTVPVFNVNKPEATCVCRPNLPLESLQQLRISLMAYNDHVSGVTLPSFMTHLNYPQLVDNIMNNYQFISKPEDITSMGAYSPSLAQHFYEVLDKHCPLLEHTEPFTNSCRDFADTDLLCNSNSSESDGFSD